MAKTRRRGGGAFDGIKKFLGFKTKEEKCADAKKKADEECAPAPITGEQAKGVADASAEASGAPPAGAPPAAAPAQQTAGRSRRRRQTRRKYKAGKHRKH